MEELKKRLKDLNVLSRKNVSVPNPSDTDTGTVDQVKSYLENGILFRKLFSPSVKKKNLQILGRELAKFSEIATTSEKSEKFETEYYFNFSLDVPIR